jgi:hypothetical protein
MKTLAIIPFALLFAMNLPAQVVDEVRADKKENKEINEVKWYHDKDKNHHARLTFAFQPTQMLLTQTFRTDAEIRLGKSRGWLQLGVNVPFTTDVIWDDDDYDNPSIKGVGLDLNYKYFLSRYFYVAGGLSWNYYNISYDDWGWFKFKEDGVEYQEYKRSSFDQTINRFGFNTLCGFQKISRHGFLCDVYMGLTPQKGFFSHPDSRKFDSSIYSRGYTGCVFMFGIRIGSGVKIGSYL